MTGKKIVIDARMYYQSGIGRYIRNLILKLQDLDKNNDYYILCLKEDYGNLIFNNNFHKVEANFHWYGIGEQIKLLSLLNSLKADLVHFPHFNAPFFYSGRFVVTIHDLIHQHFKMKKATTLNPFFYFLKQASYMRIFKNAVSKSQNILVPSNYVKDLLIREWKVNPLKITVTYEAIDERIISTVKKDRKETNKTLKKFDINPPFLFYVGNAHPHKNVAGLILAFKKLKEDIPDLSLVLSGADHYFWQQIKQEFSSKDIIFTGFITDDQLVDLYKKANCFVMPSFEEGFGIPILEAMAAGCPVVSSNQGSLPEVGGDACIYFDPYNKDNMADKMGQLLKSEKLKKEQIAKGFKRIEQFSWEKLAEQTLEIYEKSL